MKDTSKLLPIGSVVLLNNGTKNIMITGFYSVPANDNSKVYDYCGCLFPEGVISSEQNLLFDHNQIMKVLYMGFASPEEKDFKMKLGEIINNTNDNSQTPLDSTPATEAQATEAPAVNDVVQEANTATPLDSTPVTEIPTAEETPVVEQANQEAPVAVPNVSEASAEENVTEIQTENTEPNNTIEEVAAPQNDTEVVDIVNN